MHLRGDTQLNTVGRVLLIGSIDTSWRSWLKENRGDRDLLVLDPADPDHGQLARLALFRGDKLISWRFYGSLDASRAPHVLISALGHMLPHAGEDAVVQLFPYRGTPLIRHVVVLLAQMVAPEEIFVPANASFDVEGFPVGPHAVEIEAAFPETVRAAQRKANWLKLAEKCVEHRVDLGGVAIEGARIGSGRKIDLQLLAKIGVEEVFHAEDGGGTLFLVTEEEPTDQHLARALDVFHCGRAHIVAPDAYNGLLCSFARQNGEDFGTGFVQNIDFRTRTANILCDAVPPAPVRILKLGGLRIDSAGRELGEARPWQV